MTDTPDTPAPHLGTGTTLATPAAPTRRDPEFWIAIGALAVSAIAMLSSVLQFTVQRSQERAAAWPHLSLGGGFSSEGFRYVVQNKGMGPALVRRVELRLDGEPKADWPALLDGLFGEGHPYTWDRVRATDVQDGVMAPGERIEAFAIGWDERVRAAIGDGSRISVRVCYCSVLGDCWITREGIDHESVDACPAGPLPP